MKQDDFLRRQHSRPVREITDTQYAPPLSKAVKLKRGERTLRDLAEELGVTHTAIQRVEGGAKPDAPLLLKLLQWLGVIDAQNARRLMEWVDNY